MPRPTTTLADLGHDERSEEPDRQLRRPVPAQPGHRPGSGGHQPHHGASDGDWFDSGTTVNLSADLNVAKAAGERYHFANWSGASTDTTLATSVTMSAPKSLTANYGVQYQLSLATAPAAVGTTHISGASDGDWFDSGTTVNLSADLNVAKAAGERYHFANWSGASTDTTLATSVTMSAPKSLTANYGVQYQLSLATAPAAVGTTHISGASDGDWFDSGTTVNLSADLNVANPGERYHFANWSGASTDTTLATSVTMSAPKSLTANYGVQYQLSLATAPAAVGTTHISGASDGDWFDSAHYPLPERRPERRQGSRRALPLRELERCLDRHHPGHLGHDERSEEPDRQLRRPVPAQPGHRPGSGGHHAHQRGPLCQLVRLGHSPST